MTCRESVSLDLADFLTRASAQEFTAFRGHYPRCADCSAEVRAWTELHAALSASAHPSPDTLLRYRDASLADADGRGVARHLAACAPCRDELRALAAFDRQAAPRAVAERRPWLRMPEWGRFALHPALAYGLVLALLFYPALRNLGPSGTDAPLPRSPGDAEDGTRDDRLAVPSREKRAAPAEQERKDDSGLGFHDTLRQEAPAARAPEPPKLAAKQRAVETPEPSAPTASGRAEADDSAGGSLAGLAKAKRGSAAAVVVLLDPRARARLDVADEAGEVTLRAPVRPQLRSAGPLEVRVYDESGGREIRERIAAPADHVHMRIPRAWLVAGTYRLEVRAAGEATDEDAFDFEVRRPNRP
jgi:hypothetical protein